MLLLLAALAALIAGAQLTFRDPTTGLVLQHHEMHLLQLDAATGILSAYSGPLGGEDHRAWAGIVHEDIRWLEIVWGDRATLYIQEESPAPGDASAYFASRYPEAGTIRVNRALFIGIPLLLIALALGTWAATRLFSALRVEQRLASGRCPACGYPLDSARCPECGQAAPWYEPRTE